MVLLDPIAFAGWVGLFITAFNLFPIGQLDGGHIVYALFGPAHRHIARTAFAILLAMGVYGMLSLLWDLPQGWPGWLALAFFLALFGKEHPASTLIVAGVKFMGETARILSPEKRVFMPTLEATCSLDIGCPEQEFSDFCDQHPDRTVVVYANTSAAVLSLIHI